MSLSLRASSTRCEVSGNSGRTAVERLLGSVCIITAGRGVNLSGTTVTTVSLLSVEPPTLVVGIANNASVWPLLKKRGVFGVNVLSAEQIELAERFSGNSCFAEADRFDGVAWMTLVSGVPLLIDGLAAFDCEVENIVECRSHVVVIGRVLDQLSAGDRRGLVHWKDQYVALDHNQAAARMTDLGLPTPRALWEI